jgi:chromosome segregation ATPase
MTDYSDLVTRLREHAENMYVDFLNEAADAIELLQRELKCSKEMWEQQQELALEYLADIEKANERIAELEAALKPFAYYAEQIPDDVSDMASASGTVGDLRQARKVLGEKE